MDSPLAVVPLSVRFEAIVSKLLVVAFASLAFLDLNVILVQME